MSGIKPITSYFKVRSKDELEVEELEEDRLYLARFMEQ